MEAAHHSDTNREPDDITPSTLIRLRAGDPIAADLFNGLYRDRLFRCCWGYLQDMDEAEDAVQDVSASILASDSVPDAFLPWAYTIARNHCRNLLRSRGRRKDGQPLPAPSRTNDPVTGMLTRLVRDENQARLIELFAELPETQQEVLRLRHVEQLSRDQIAQIVGVSLAVVKSRLHEGLKKLRANADELRPT